VSRDVFVQDIPADARSTDDITDTWTPDDLPFGPDDVISAVLANAPTANFSDPTWGHIELPGIDIEVNLPDEIPLRSFAFHVRSTDREATNRLLTAILDRLDVRAFDAISEGGIFPPRRHRRPRPLRAPR
jgi:hypothetical protein